MSDGNVTGLVPCFVQCPNCHGLSMSTQYYDYKHRKWVSKAAICTNCGDRIPAQVE